MLGLIVNSIALFACSLNIGFAISDKNWHSALGWTCADIFALIVLIDKLKA